MRSIAAVLASRGSVFATITGHDSGCTSYGVEGPGGRWFVKAAYGDDVAQLRSATAFHAAVRHPAIVPLLDAEPVDGGLALIYPWVSGEVLNDPFAPGAVPREAPDSALHRVRRLPIPRALSMMDTILDAHLAVARAGFVAVDFYDGCIMYDFARDVVRLVDLDLYRPGPYLLDLERQYGSTAFMAPEEFVRGAVIDERTTVFTLGRTAMVLLTYDGWRGTPDARRVAEVATSAEPEERYPTVQALYAAWTTTSDG